MKYINIWPLTLNCALGRDAREHLCNIISQSDTIYFSNIWPLTSVTLTTEVRTQVLDSTHCLDVANISTKLFQHPPCMTELQPGWKSAKYLHRTKNEVFVCYTDSFGHVGTPAIISGRWLQVPLPNNISGTGGHHTWNNYIPQIEKSSSQGEFLVLWLKQPILKIYGSSETGWVYFTCMK